VSVSLFSGCCSLYSGLCVCLCLGLWPAPGCEGTGAGGGELSLSRARCLFGESAARFRVGGRRCLDISVFPGIIHHIDQSVAISYSTDLSYTLSILKTQ
jgi:hypothetical protein